MSIRITYDEEIDGFVIKASGVVMREDILVSLDEFLNHPKFRQNINQLFDCTEAFIGLTTQDLMSVSSYFSSISSQLGHHRKLALVVLGDLNYGIMRQYEALFDSGPNVSVSVFKSLSDARKWLKPADKK